MHKHRPSFIEYLVFRYLKGYYLSNDEFDKVVFSCKKCGSKIKLHSNRIKFYVIWTIVLFSMLPIMLLILMGMLEAFSNENSLPLIVGLSMLLITIPCIPDTLLYFITKYDTVD